MRTSCEATPDTRRRLGHRAILGREPGWQELEKRLAAAAGPFFVSPLVKFEAATALARQKTQADAAKPSPDLVRRAHAAVDAFIEALAAEEIAISPDIGRRAVEAAAAYGKVVGHPADLNFGDCFAYASAKALNVALIYKGDDFARTDLG